MNRKYTVAVDLDGTLATYDKWRGEEFIGRPMPWARESMEELREWNWRIIVFTTRGDEATVRQWLRSCDIPFDGVNTTDHNPEGCSSKPIAEVYVDDRSWWDVKRRFSWCRVMKRLRRIYRDPDGLDTFLDDAACWGPWWFRLFGITWFTELSHKQMIRLHPAKSYRGAGDWCFYD